MYRNTYSLDFPFAENGDEHIHEVIKDIKGILWKKENGEIFYYFNENPLTYNTTPSAKRKIDSPPGLARSTPSKRSRSAPNNDNHVENKENRPRGRQQVRFNFNKEQKEKHDTRSKSEHRPKSPSAVIIYLFKI